MAEGHLQNPDKFAQSLRRYLDRTEGDSAVAFRYWFLEKFQQRPENMSSQQSIYRIPSFLRDLDPNAYEPHVVSIGPYHHGKEQLQAMEEHKHRALNRFLNINGGISLDDILAEFKREPSFSEKVRNCYTFPLEPKWSDDDVFLHLMVLDGCFLLELLLDGYPIPYPTFITNLPEKHALLSYVKIDMLILDNQIPILVLRKLASIAKLPTGSENVFIPVENENIKGLIWKFYGTMKIPADLPDDAHHVLDAYWRKFCIGTDAYDGGASRLSATELNSLKVLFRPTRDEGVADRFVRRRSFRKVAFHRADNIFIRLYRFLYSASPAEPSNNSQRIRMFIRLILIPVLFPTFWSWYKTVGIAEGTFYLPPFTIDETTRPTLLNLMAFERLHLHYEETHPVTNYVLLMASLIRKEKDVEHLRDESILLCSSGWTDESVVKLFADLTKDVAFNGTRNPNIDALWSRSKFFGARLSSKTNPRPFLIFALYTLIVLFVKRYV